MCENQRQDKGSGTGDTVIYLGDALSIQGRLKTRLSDRTYISAIFEGYHNDLRMIKRQAMSQNIYLYTQV
jgi:hypothetical protein